MNLSASHLSETIQSAVQQRRPIVVEIGCGEKATWLQELAGHHPETLYIGVDPALKLGLSCPQNVFLYPGDIRGVLSHLVGCVDQFFVVAPYFGVREARHLRNRVENDPEVFARPSSPPDPLYISLRTALRRGGTLRIFTEAPEWAPYFFSQLGGVFPQVETRAYAKPTGVVHHEGGPHLRIESSGFNDCGIKDYIVCPLMPIADLIGPKLTGQWANLVGFFGALADQLLTPVFPREKAPPSSFLGSFDTVFELVGRN